MQWMIWLWPTVFVIAVLVTGAIRHLALQRQMLDLPVARSAHSTPTPHGGGLTIVITFILLTSFFFFQGLLDTHIYLALLGAVWIAGVGLFDDLYQLHVYWRMPLHFFAAGWSIYWLGGVPEIAVSSFVITQQWLLNILGALALVWLLNLYNFMDGIDGIAGAELLFVNLLALLFVITGENTSASLVALVLISSGAGFLVWNWPPAKIFMGDVGSGFCGFTLGLLALITMQSGVMSVWTWVILLAVFVTDATFTLVRRVLRREPWYEGHASHAYQNAARQYQSHSKVTITMLLINCFWLAPIAYLSVLQPELGIFLSLIALSPLVFTAYKLQAGVS